MSGNLKKFTDLIAELTSANDESMLNLKFMELTALMVSENKPSFPDFVDWAKSQDNLEFTNLVSLCLDTYVPFSDAVVKLIDPQWVMIHSLTKQTRETISQSFTNLLVENNQDEHFIFELAIHLSTMKYSGIFSEFCFDIYYGELAQRMDGLDVTKLTNFTDEHLQIFPEKIIRRLIQVTSTFYGQSACKKLINYLFSNGEILIMEDGWLKYEEWFKSLVQQDLITVCTKIEPLLADASIDYKKSAFCYCQDWRLFDIKLNHTTVTSIQDKYPEILLV